MALIDRIEELILSDDDGDRDDQSDLLIQEYQNLPAETAKAVDSIFVCLCGYSLNRIISEY